MAAPQGGAERATFDGGQTDKREEVSDYDRYHSPYNAIFQVETTCKCTPGRGAGSCFLLPHTYLGEGYDSSSHWYFVTAGHVLYCRDCNSYQKVQVLSKWQPIGDIDDPKAPKSLLNRTVSGDKDADGFTWVHDDFIKNPRTDADPNKQFPYDIGVICVAKTSVQLAHKDWLEDAALNSFGSLATGDAFPYNRGFICGFPLHFPYEKGGTETLVVGQMYHMPHKIDGNTVTFTANGDQPEEQRRSRSLFSMPQNHFDESGSQPNTSQDIVKERLFRHYLHTSSGQSGAPVIIEDGGGWRVIGIHVGYWKFLNDEEKYNNGCNVAVKLSFALPEIRKLLEKTSVGQESGDLVFSRSEEDVASPFKPLTEERRPDVLVVPPLEVKSCTQGKQAGLSKTLDDGVVLRDLAKKMEGFLNEAEEDSFTRETVRHLKEEVNNYEHIIKRTRANNNLRGNVEAALFLLSNARCSLSKVVDLVCIESPRHRTKMEKLVRDLERK